MPILRTLRSSAAIALAALVSAVPTKADDYPSRPVTLVVPALRLVVALIVLLLSRLVPVPTPVEGVVHDHALRRHERAVGRAHRHARGVPAVADGVRTVARGRPAHAMERHFKVRCPHTGHATHRPFSGTGGDGVTLVAGDGLRSAP